MASEKTIDRAAIRAASEIKPVPNAKSHPDVIVLDTETTGLVAGRDHLLTVGVCDGDGRSMGTTSRRLSTWSTRCSTARRGSA